MTLYAICKYLTAFFMVVTAFFRHASLNYFPTFNVSVFSGLKNLTRLYDCWKVSFYFTYFFPCRNFVSNTIPEFSEDAFRAFKHLKYLWDFTSILLKGLSFSYHQVTERNRNKDIVIWFLEGSHKFGSIIALLYILRRIKSIWECEKILW